MMKRKFRRGVRRDTVQITSNVNTGGFNFGKRKRQSYSSWRRRMWNASAVQQKYRSNNAIPGTFSTSTSTSLQVVFIAAVIPDSGGGNRFWQPGGGLITNNDTPATTDFGGGDLFIRGGVARISCNNNTAETAKISIWRIRTTINGNIPTTPFTVSAGWDPTLPDPALLATDPNRDVWKLYKVWGCQEYMLKPGEAFERATKIRAQKIDQDQWLGLRSRDFWVLTAQNIETVNALVLNVVQSWNISFTGDRVV